MKQLFLDLPQINLYKCNENDLILLDTCFLIYVFDHSKQKALERLCVSQNVALTSFNANELIYNINRINDKTKDHIRHFLKKKLIKLLEISIMPGNRQHEVEFTKLADPSLLTHVADPSDAVLVAAAILANAKVILTRDKHHLFTTELENFLKNYNVQVHNEIKDGYL